MADKTVLATLDWTYNQISWQQELAKSRDQLEDRRPSRQAVRRVLLHGHQRLGGRTRPRPRLFLEYMYSPTGQNLWLEGGGVPATITAMQKAGTVSKAAEAAIPPLPAPPEIATVAQETAAQKIVCGDWASAVG